MEKQAKTWRVENARLVLTDQAGVELAIWLNDLPAGVSRREGKKLYPAGIWDIDGGEIHAAMSAVRTDI